ncbi:MAG: hypothetical protein ACRD29_07480 [Acidimicrobiales bacterium]
MPRVAVTVMVLASFAACGGDPADDAALSLEGWAADVCEALDTELANLEDVSTAINAATASEGTTGDEAERLLGEVTDAFEQGVESLGRLAERLEEIGPPESASGAAYHDALLDGTRGAVASGEAALTELRELDGSQVLADPARLQAPIARFRHGPGIFSAVEALDRDEIAEAEAALDDPATCS